MADVQLDFKPFEHQRLAHKLRLAIRFLVLVWHRRGGKTVFSIVELVLAALACTRERGRFGYVAPFLKQAKAVAWDYLKHYTRPIPGCSYNEQELAVDLPNGARIRLFGADNPDALRGLYFDGVVMDEVADMRPQVWGEIIRPALADRQGWAIFIGTPKGVNLFSELYYEAARGRDGWGADLKRAADTGVIPVDEVEHARLSMSPPQFAQEFDCDFAAAVENALVPLDAVLTAQARRVGTAEFNYYPRILGIDVAGYGDDLTVFFPRQGPVAMVPRAMRGLDPMQVAEQAARSIDGWKPHAVFVDRGGIGHGVTSRLEQLGYANVTAVEFGWKPSDDRFQNKRAEMWWDMAEWVKAEGCLPSTVAGVPMMNGRLVTDLTAPTYSYANARGKVQLESKDDMRERGLPSPDFGDALALTFAYPVPFPASGDSVHGGGRARIAEDWDPLKAWR